MIFRWLTRIPGGRTPADVFTGSPPLNAYLAELDKRLLGTAAVRMQTLLEVRDHMQERIAFMVESGTDEREAAERAVAAMPIDEQVAAQSARLNRKFISVAASTGLLWGGLMAVLWWGLGMDDGDTVKSVLTWLAGGAVFGIALGWWATYLVSERSPAKPGADKDAGTVVAGYSRLMRVTSFLAAVAFAVAGVGALALGVAAIVDAEYAQRIGMAPWALILLGLIGLLDAKIVSGARRRIALLSDELAASDLFGLRRRFNLSELTRVGTLGEDWRWLPKYWRRVRFAEFATPGGGRKRVYIYPDMINADRLYAMLTTRVQA